MYCDLLDVDLPLRYYISCSITEEYLPHRLLLHLVFLCHGTLWLFIPVLFTFAPCHCFLRTSLRTPIDVTGEKGGSLSDAYRRRWGEGRVT